jgi:lysozyme
MKTSDTGLAFIRDHEGLRLTAYPDPGTGGEPWTIGVGHTGGVSPGDTCTLDDAMQWLREDVGTAEGAIARLVKVSLTQNQFDALVSFIFNLGANAFAGSTLLKLLNAGDYDGAEAQFERWSRAGGHEMAGLLKRRHAEAALFASEFA